VGLINQAPTKESINRGLDKSSPYIHFFLFPPFGLFQFIKVRI